MSGRLSVRGAVMGLLNGVLIQFALPHETLALPRGDHGFGGAAKEYLRTQPTRLLMVGVCVVVVLFILGKLGLPIVKRLLWGLIYGTVASVVLWIVFPLVGLPRDLVGVIGLVAFALGAIFGRIGTGR
jgi:hypothetical protein